MNYKHLQYFVAVAKAGSISQAARALNLAPQTVSHQLGLLEESLNTRLLERRGGSWQVTDSGAVALKYAEEIFALGKELTDALRGTQSDQPLTLNVGITDAIAKHVAYRLIAPAMDLDARISVNCIEGSLQSLGEKLADHTLDVLLADRPIDRHIMPKCQNFLLHESQLSFMCVPALVPPGEFPMNLDQQPFLILSDHHNLAHQLHAWFEHHSVHPDIVGRFDDSALLKAFARSGRGICAIPSMIEAEVSREYGLVCIGKSATLGETYYAVMVPRKVDHPGVTAICTTGTKL